MLRVPRAVRADRARRDRVLAAERQDEAVLARAARPRPSRGRPRRPRAPCCRAATPAACGRRSGRPPRRARRRRARRSGRPRGSPPGRSWCRRRRRPCARTGRAGSRRGSSRACSLREGCRGSWMRGTSADSTAPVRTGAGPRGPAAAAPAAAPRGGAAGAARDLAGLAGALRSCAWRARQSRTSSWPRPVAIAVSSKMSSAVREGVAEGEPAASRASPSGRCESLPTIASACLIRSVAARGSDMRKASGETTSSMIVESRPGSGSPSGAASRTRARTIGRNSSAKSTASSKTRPAPALRVEHVEQRPEEVARPVRVVGVDLPQHRGELRAAARRAARPRA